MIDARRNPGNANLPIGGRKEENREIGSCGQQWRSRGYLPHLENSEATQHVIFFHLADSLPKSALQRIEVTLKNLPTGKGDVERRKRLEEWIDACHGSCSLGEPVIANLVQESLLTFDLERYRLLAWVVMPNHVHALFQPRNGWTVGKIVATWKKFTARKICDNVRKKGGMPAGPVWHREYWDRYIRDRRHYSQVVEYIHMNPVKAGFVVAPEKWRWSSAYTGNAGEIS